MASEQRPGHDAVGHRFCLVAARFNEAYVRRLVDAALEVLRHRVIENIEHADVRVCR